LDPIDNDSINLRIQQQGIFMTEKAPTKSSVQTARYTGRLETCSERRVAGWILDQDAPAVPVMLDLVINGRVIDTQLADKERREPLGNGIRRTRRNGFEFVIPPELFMEGTLNLSLFVSDTDQQLLGPAIVMTPYDMALRAIGAACEMLNGVPERGSEGVDGGSSLLLSGADRSYWVRTQVMAKVLGTLRASRTIPASITIDLKPLVLHKPGLVKKEQIVDVIIPVYRGRIDTMQCIESVLNAVNETECALIIVNDKSPDEDLTRELRELQQKEDLALIENEANLGFVATVNRAMELHPARDVILLNSDTVVPSARWVDRLRRAAYSAGNIGTVTPFSDNAEILSFPLSCTENTLPEGLPLAEVDTLFAERNAGMVVDLPTAVGFCMYIKREALDETGYFDERRWGRGYGEENDFCLKAAALGWRHVAACDLFVRHVGGVSFGEEKDVHTKKHLALLNSIYPDYTAAVHRFVRQDPLRRYRHRVIKEILKRHADKFLLFVMHTLGGGTSIAAEALAGRLDQEDVAVLELVGNADQQWSVHCFGLPYRLQYRFSDDWDELVEDLRELGVWHIHYHQTLFFPKAIFELPGRLAVRYDYTVHDHLPLCPRITMIDETGHYCRESQFSTETCDRCIRYNGFDEHADLEEKFDQFGGSVKLWRAGYADFMAQARKVFFLSDDTLNRFNRHFPQDKAIVKPHPEDRHRLIPAEHCVDTPYPIALIGGIGQHKGYDILLQCVRSARKEGLPLKFIVFGYTSDDEQLIRCGNVEVTGPYELKDLDALVKGSGCSVAAFLSACPETFSFTLSEAWRLGLFPVAFDIGAIAERIRKVGFGRLMPFTQDPKVINAILLEAVGTSHTIDGAVYIGETYRAIMNDYYELQQ
jgi:GT2 family glycosyltransferase